MPRVKTDIKADLSATGTIAAATRTSTHTEINTAIQLKPVYQIIYFDRFGFFQKIFIDQIFNPVNIINLIVIARLVQSHGQRRPASPSLIKKNANGLGIPTLKIQADLFCCRRGYLYHGVLLINKKPVRPFRKTIQSNQMLFQTNEK